MSTAHNIQNNARNAEEAEEMAANECDTCFVNDDDAVEYEFCDGSVLLVSDADVYAYGSR